MYHLGILFPSVLHHCYLKLESTEQIYHELFASMFAQCKKMFKLTINKDGVVKK